MLTIISEQEGTCLHCGSIAEVVLYIGVCISEVLKLTLGPCCNKKSMADKDSVSISENLDCGSKPMIILHSSVPVKDLQHSKVYIIINHHKL